MKEGEKKKSNMSEEEKRQSGSDSSFTSLMQREAVVSVHMATELNRAANFRFPSAATRCC